MPVRIVCGVEAVATAASCLLWSLIWDTQLWTVSEETPRIQSQNSKWIQLFPFKILIIAFWLLVLCVVHPMRSHNLIHIFCVHNKFFVKYGRWNTSSCSKLLLLQLCYYHETDSGEIKATTQCHLENNVMIGYWYTFEPKFLLGKTASVQYLNLTRFAELIKISNFRKKLK